MKNIPDGWEYKESDSYPLAATLTRGNVRVVVSYLEGTDCPLEGYDTIELLPLAYPRLSRYDYAYDTLGVAYAMRDAANYAADDDAYRDAILKHCTRQDYATIVRSWRGYSQGDWFDYVLISNNMTAETLAAIADEFESWLAGDVFVATTESRAIYANIADPDDTIERWLPVESVGEYYGPYWELDAKDILSDLDVL
jgi:hypothetical protein